MKGHFWLLLVLLITVAVASCGGGEEYEAIAASFEEAINTGDASAAAVLWAEEGHFEIPQDPWTGTGSIIICTGKTGIRDCAQIIIDRGIKFSFSKYRVKGTFLCFEFGDSLDGVNWRIGPGHLRFEGDKITYFGPSSCPGEW
jgi:hypothetical protein